MNLGIIRNFLSGRYDMRARYSLSGFAFAKDIHFGSDIDLLKIPEGVAVLRGNLLAPLESFSSQRRL